MTPSRLHRVEYATGFGRSVDMLQWEAGSFIKVCGLYQKSAPRIGLYVIETYRVIGPHCHSATIPKSSRRHEVLIPGFTCQIAGKGFKSSGQVKLFKWERYIVVVHEDDT